MSECVVRMEMPHDGLCDLAFSFLDRTCCTIKGDLCNYCDDGVIPKWCPILCQLPEGHGRLVDKEEMLKKIENYHRYMTIGRESDPRCIIEDSPTIVPAEA